MLYIQEKLNLKYKWHKY